MCGLGSHNRDFCTGGLTRDQLELDPQDIHIEGRGDTSAPLRLLLHGSHWFLASKVQSSMVQVQVVQVEQGRCDPHGRGLLSHPVATFSSLARGFVGQTIVAELQVAVWLLFDPAGQLLLLTGTG